MDITIRVATPEDSEVVTGIISASYVRLDPDLQEPGGLAATLPLMSKANPKLLTSGRYYIAAVGGVPAACGGWSFDEPGSGRLEAGLAHIRHFATHPDHSRKGLARLLLDRCMEDSRKASATRIRAWSTLDAVGFYEAGGFVRVRDLVVEIGSKARLRSVEMERSL